LLLAVALVIIYERESDERVVTRVAVWHEFVILTQNVVNKDLESGRVPVT
jgi:hypothetical protein